MKYKIIKLEERTYPICPECGKHTIVAFTPPDEQKEKDNTDENGATKGTPYDHIDWNRAHLYCCNGETNCKFNTRFIDLTTPLKEPK